MPQVGCNLEQRFQYESAVEHPRMWNRELWGRHKKVPEQQNVNIDDAWATPHGSRWSFPAEVSFDALDHAEQLHGKILRFAFDRHIQKPRLPNHILRLCFVYQRSFNDMDALALERAKRPI